MLPRHFYLVADLVGGGSAGARGGVRSHGERATRFIDPGVERPAVPEDVDGETLFALLDDEYARGLLVRLTESPMTAQQLHDETDASLATVYRRLDALADCGLVAERTRIDGDGNHYAVYEAALEEIRVRLTGDGLETTVDARGDVADRFTRIWGEM